MKMKKNKFCSLLNSLILLIGLSSCSFSDFVSEFNDKYNDLTSMSKGYFHTDTGNSIELIQNAFNSKINDENETLVDDFSNNELDTTYSRIHINENVTDLQFNEGITPSTGKVKGLVIPVDFNDYPISDKVYSKTLPSYQSVSSYYYNSSYGALDITFDVMDWYRLSHPASYYKNLSNKKYYGEVPGVSAIIHEVLDSLDEKINLKDYDSNNDGYIDCIHIIYSHPINRLSADFWWAYQYYNLNEIYYDEVLPYAYVFASFYFLFEEDEACNARTYIHETGHLFGLEDYYDYDTKVGFNKGGLGGFDMMDATIGEHNPFSKMALGWIKDPILLDLSTQRSATITIDSFEKNGDTILIPASSNYKFDESKGMFQSYLLVQLINPKSRLLKDEYREITKMGLRIYEVNAQLKTFKDGNESYVYYEYDNSYTDKNIINAINNKDAFYYSKREYNSLCATNSDLFHSFMQPFALPNPNQYVRINELWIDDKLNLNAKIEFVRIL